MKYRERRKPTDFEVVLLTETGERKVDVVDVTSAGMRIRAMPDLLESDAETALCLRGRRYAARVVWAKQGEIGLAFAHALPVDVVSLITRERRKGGIKRKRFLMP